MLGITCARDCSWFIRLSASVILLDRRTKAQQLHLPLAAWKRDCCRNIARVWCHKGTMWGRAEKAEELWGLLPEETPHSGYIQLQDCLKHQDRPSSSPLYKKALRQQFSAAAWGTQPMCSTLLLCSAVTTNNVTMTHDRRYIPLTSHVKMYSFYFRSVCARFINVFIRTDNYQEMTWKQCRPDESLQRFWLESWPIWSNWTVWLDRDAVSAADIFQLLLRPCQVLLNYYRDLSVSSIPPPRSTADHTGKCPHLEFCKDVRRDFHCQLNLL